MRSVTTRRFKKKSATLKKDDLKSPQKLDSVGLP